MRKKLFGVTLMICLIIGIVTVTGCVNKADTDKASTKESKKIEKTVDSKISDKKSKSKKAKKDKVNKDKAEKKEPEKTNKIEKEGVDKPKTVTKDVKKVDSDKKKDPHAGKKWVPEKTKIIHHPAEVRDKKFIKSYVCQCGKSFGSIEEWTGHRPHP